MTCPDCKTPSTCSFNGCDARQWPINKERRAQGLPPITQCEAPQTEEQRTIATLGSVQRVLKVLGKERAAAPSKDATEGTRSDVRTSDSAPASIPVPEKGMGEREQCLWLRRLFDLIQSWHDTRDGTPSKAEAWSSLWAHGQNIGPHWQARAALAQQALPAQYVPMTDAEIIEEAMKWTKEAPWFEFERNDYIAAARAIESATVQRMAQAAPAEDQLQQEYQRGYAAGAADQAHASRHKPTPAPAQAAPQPNTEPVHQTTRAGEGFTGDHHD